MEDDKKIKNEDEEINDEENTEPEENSGKETGNEAAKSDREENFEHKYKRALADYQNLLKRTAEEKKECARFANEDLIREILSVYNHLKLALKHVPEPGEKCSSVEEGLQYVLKQFKSILENNGVAEIETFGKKFDPRAMEAIDKKETENEARDGQVASEVKPGYLLYGRVVEPARVVVYEFKRQAEC